MSAVADQRSVQGLSQAPGADTSRAATMDRAFARTLDLAELARVARGDRVEVQPVEDPTQLLFEQTIALLDIEGSAPPEIARQRIATGEFRYVPKNEDLRKLYFFAEAVGGYETLHELFSTHSPGQLLSLKYGEKAVRSPLSPAEVATLEHYYEQMKVAIRNATRYLRSQAIDDFQSEDIHELYKLLVFAGQRVKEINRIIGVHLMFELERAVERLHGYFALTRRFERTVSGIFLVDSEVMFVPASELTESVNIIFKAVGNSHLAQHVDGVLLLAARNLLIEVVSFYSYYGKQQIYQLFRRGGANVSSQVVSAYIRREIGTLFEACRRDNRLVLTRIMKDAEREFEVSVEAIRREAEEEAVQAVSLIFPAQPPPPPAPRVRGWFRRTFGWLLD